MSDLLDHAVQALRPMPENIQDAAAQAILDYTATIEDQSPSPDRHRNDDSTPR